jgi:hypothetical protein
VAAGGIHVATAWHDALAVSVIFGGQPVTTGGVVSITSMSKEHADEFPTASVAVYVTVVIPSGKVSPGL